LWYLPMFSCLMLFVPFINKWLIGDKPSSDDLRSLYYVFFFFFFLNGISSIAYNTLEIKIVWFKIFPWFIAYFIGGYYIDKYGNNFSISNTKILSAIIFLIFTGSIINYFFAHHYGILKDNLVLGSVSPFIFIIAFLIFLFAKVNSHRFKESKTISRVSEASFGMYLIHPVFIYFLRNVLSSYNLSASVNIFLTIILTALVSFFFIMALRKFSFMKIIC